VVTRPYQSDTTQLWRLTGTGGGTFTLQQVSSNRFDDAHGIPEQDWRVVTRPEQQFDNTQRWAL